MSTFSGEWIDITKRKPEHGQKVIVSAGDIVTAAIADTSFYDDGNIWWDGCGFRGHEWDFDFEPNEVTHWAPIPQPAMKGETP